MRTLTPVLALALLLPACSGEAAGTDEPKAAESAKVEVDVLTERACGDFQRTLADSDVLTDEELRERVKTIHDRGRYAEQAGVPEASRALLAAITADDVDAFVAAAEEMSAACAPA